MLKNEEGAITFYVLNANAPAKSEGGDKKGNFLMIFFETNLDFLSFKINSLEQTKANSAWTSYLSLSLFFFPGERNGYYITSGSIFIIT